MFVLPDELFGDDGNYSMVLAWRHPVIKPRVGVWSPCPAPHTINALETLPRQSRRKEKAHKHHCFFFLNLPFQFSILPMGWQWGLSGIEAQAPPATALRTDSPEQHSSSSTTHLILLLPCPALLFSTASPAIPSQETGTDIHFICSSEAALWF